MLAALTKVMDDAALPAPFKIKYNSISGLQRMGVHGFFYPRVLLLAPFLGFEGGIDLGFSQNIGIGFGGFLKIVIDFKIVLDFLW